MRALALASWLVLLTAGCGGSSSETPPPLEPDPTSGRYTGPRLPSRADEAARKAAAEPEQEPEEAPLRPARPARATWGSGKPTSTAPAAPALPPRPAPSN